MTLLGRLWRAIGQKIGSPISKKQDPEKILEEAIVEMEDRLVELRRAIAGASAAHRNTTRQLDSYLAKAKIWHDRARLALKHGNEALAKEALQRRQPYQNYVQKLQIESEEQTEIVSRFKQDLLALETKISLAKAKRNIYQIRARSAAATKTTRESIDESKLAVILSKMEAKAIDLEADSTIIDRKDYDKDLEKKFSDLEVSNNIINEEPSEKTPQHKNKGAETP